MSNKKGSWSARNPQLVQIPRGSGKSTMSHILQGMDFGKLEQTAVAHMAKNKSVLVSAPSITGKSMADFYAIMADSYEVMWMSPKPHCQAKVFALIDQFWAHPELGIVHLYLEQLRKNPLTRDLFKGESTTHHYPWYKRGTKY